MTRFSRLFTFVLAVVMCLSVSVGCDVSDYVSVTPTSAEVQTVRITFTEGRNARHFAKLLEQNGVCSASDFLAACADIDWSEQFDFLPSYDVLSQRDYPLEGYLYPDTYDFFVPESAESCVKRFLRNFDNRITEEMRADCAANGLSLDEVLTLASIVELETNSASEAPKVAMVFYNRINHPTGYKGIDGTYTGGYFQSDATKYYPYVYGEDIPDGFVSEYNTYNFAGLPKGPIGNPGRSSIRAAIYPDTSCDALFFYTDKYSTHYYAVTYQQHLDNIQFCKDKGLAG